MAGPDSCRTCGARVGSGAATLGLCPACLLTGALADDENGATSPVPPDASDLAPGATLGPFRIRRLVGRGGMAAVYEAREAPPLERLVALKVLPATFLHDDTFAARFTHEAQLVARLEHPGIVPIYASGIDEGIPWISMRLLAGGSLSARLERGRPGFDETVCVLQRVAEALDYAHEQGVVHRDVKPGNILLDEAGRAYIGDFGLARLTSAAGRWTRTGMLAGTPQYMAPEQGLDHDIDRRCDVYSLGVVAYEMLTGRVPFDGSSPLAVLMQHANAPLPDALRTIAPEAVRVAVARALAKTPGERWPTAMAFVRALERAPTQQSQRSRVARAVALPAAAMLVAAWLWVLVPHEGGWPGPHPGPPVGPPGGDPTPDPEPSERVDGAGTSQGSGQDPDSPHGNTSPRPDHTGFGEPPPRPTPSPPTGTDATGVEGDRTSPEPERESDPLNRIASGEAQRENPVAATNGDTSTAGSPSEVDDGNRESSPEPPTPIEEPPEEPPHPIEPRVLESWRPPFVLKSEPHSIPVPDVVTPPLLVYRAPAVYPGRAKSAEIEGDVGLEATVGTDGRVIAVEVVRRAHPLLEEAATKAVLDYQYEPGLRYGVDVVFTVPITIPFRLE